MTDEAKRVYAATIDGRARNTRYAQKELKALYETLVASHASIKRAIRGDTEYSTTEIEAEYHLTLAAAREQYQAIDVDKAYECEYRLANKKNNPERVDAVGCIYLVPSRCNLFYSTVVPLVLAIAAGNCVILELKQTPSELNATLRHLLTSALDADTFTVVDTRLDNQFFSKQYVRFLDFSGENSATRNGRAVSVVDQTCNVPDAAREITRARFSFRGASPHAPDLVLVNEFVLKEFCNAVVQNATGLLVSHVGSMANGTVEPSLKKIPKQTSPKLLSEEGTSTLLLTSQGTVVIVQKRSSKLLSTEIREPLLVIHPITSLDDAIDLSNSMSKTALLASYIFADSPGAKYLSQFINARISCTNKIPADLLIGPPTPEPYPPSLSSRFSIDMFQVPRPEYIEFPPRSTVFAELLDGGQNTDAWRSFAKKNQAPLPPTGQPEGKTIGFFEQGLITGASVLALSTAASLAFLGGYVVPVIWRRMR